MKSFLRSCILFSLGIVPAFGAADKPAFPQTYHVSNVFHVGGEGRWDYVVIDPRTKHLFVPRQTHTQILDATTGQVVADVKDTPGVHGVALVPQAKRAFISNGTGNSVTVIDLTDFHVLGKIAAGQKPDAIIYDPASNKVLAFNGKSNDVTAIDASADPAAGGTMRIALEGAPEFATSDGKGHVYVNLEDKDAVTVIDTKMMKATAVWKIEGGDAPTGMAIDAEHHRIFCGCHNQVMAVLDTETGKTIATVRIGKGVDACAFDPATGDIFASCGDGTMTVAKETTPGKFEVIQVVKTRVGARTVALDPATHTLYLPTAEFPAEAPARGRPVPVANSFMIVVVAPQK